MVRVKVKNLAAHRRVHVRCLSGPDWQDFELPCTSRYSNYDIFSGTVPHTERFAISCSMDGTVYWDNNDRQDYRVPIWANAIGGAVSLGSARIRTRGAAHRWIHGEVYVDNLSFNKRVGIRMLPVGADQWIELTGSYDGVAGEGDGGPWVQGPVERWRFTSPTFNSTDCRFAAFYQNLSSGETYWDNNFGQDYQFRGDQQLS